MFNGHRVAVERGELESDRSCLFFYCPSVADSSKEINQYLKNVSMNEWVDNGQFDPYHLDF